MIKLFHNRFNRRSVILVSLALFFLCIQNATAQRTSRYEWFIDTEYSASPLASPVLDLTHGCSLGVGQYAMESYWRVGVQFNNYHQYIYNYTDLAWQWVDYSYYAFTADWDYRIIKTYSRVFNVYVGGGLICGYREYGTFIKRFGGGIPEGLLTSDGTQVASVKGDFLYGLRANLIAELFFSPKIAFTFRVQPVLPLSNFLPADTFHLATSVGLRFNL